MSFLKIIGNFLIIQIISNFENKIVVQFDDSLLVYQLSDTIFEVVDPLLEVGGAVAAPAVWATLRLLCTHN